MMIDLDYDKDIPEDKDEYVILETKTKMRLYGADETKTYIIENDGFAVEYYLNDDEDYDDVIALDRKRYFRQNSLRKLLNKLDYTGKAELIEAISYCCRDSNSNGNICSKKCYECNSLQRNEFYINFNCSTEIEYDGQWEVIKYKKMRSL